jgi:hypothetical protein
VPTRKSARKGGGGGGARGRRPSARAPRGRRPGQVKARAKPARKAGRPKRPPVVGVGDSVLVRVDEVNPARAGRDEARPPQGGEATEGLVCSIREIATGKLVGKTKGALTEYVLEVLHQRTFKSQFSSSQNTGGRRGPNDVSSNPAWVKLRGLLREMAARSEFVSQASGGLSQQVFGSLLDGWRMVKVRAQMVELRP